MRGNEPPATRVGFATRWPNRGGWFKTVRVKSDVAHRIRILLAHRRNRKRKALDLENTLRYTLKAFGVRLHATGRKGMGAAVREATADDPMLAQLADDMLRARDVLLAEFERLSRIVSQIAAADDVCARMMSVPGVGPVTALSFKAAVDDPTRFRRARTVGAPFGLIDLSGVFLMRWMADTFAFDEFIRRSAVREQPLHPGGARVRPRDRPHRLPRPRRARCRVRAAVRGHQRLGPQGLLPWR